MQPKILQSTTLSGRACKLIDETGCVPDQELQALLADLVQTKAFGRRGLSTNSATIKLDTPSLAHIQIGDNLYRLLLFPYEARIEKF